MMSVRRSIQEGWSTALGSPVVDGKFRVCEIDAQRAGVRALISPEGHPGLLLPLSKAERFQPHKDLKPGHGGALEAEVAVFAGSDGRMQALAVWCRDIDLQDAFLSFCEALLERWIAGTSVPKALDACHAEFRRLVLSPAAVDVGVLVGLLGELLFLADLVDLAPAAVHAWGGTEKERHDFRSASVAVEVKTSLRADIGGKIVRMASIDQMQPPDGGRLFLHVVQLERVAGGTTSLSGLVSRIEAKLDVAGLKHFRSVLGMNGPIEADVRRTFSTLSRSTYEVRHDFPCLVAARLLTGKLDAGVARVRYDLDLSGASHFLVPDEFAIRAMATEGRG